MKHLSVVVIMRNEQAHIRNCLLSLLRQSYPAEDYEVIVVDGRSSDSSAEIVRSLQSEHRNLRLFDNPAGITPAGMNLGIRNATGQIIVIAGAHAVYPREFLASAVQCLAQTGADAVGGPVAPLPANGSLGARLVAAILQSPFGVGNSRFRTSAEEGFVDTVPFGAYRREVFDRVGLFNQRLVRNQDNDLSARMRSAGGRIFLSPLLTTIYHPAATLGQLLGNTWRNSQWHVATLRENPRALGFRHVVPAAFVGGLAALALLSMVYADAWPLLGTVVGAHLLAGFLFSPAVWRKFGAVVALAFPAGCLCFHVAYGLGTLAGLRFLFSTPAAQPIRPGLPVEEP